MAHDIDLAQFGRADLAAIGEWDARLNEQMPTGSVTPYERMTDAIDRGDADTIMALLGRPAGEPASPEPQR